MATIIEQKIDLFINLANSSLQLIPSELLNAETVSSFLEDLKNETDIINLFLLKIEIKKLVEFFDKNIITESMLITLFNSEKYQKIKIIEILRRINFEVRKKIISELTLLNPDKFNNIEEDIDAKYGILQGILIKDVSYKAKKLSVEETIWSFINNPEISTDYYLQELDSLNRTQPKELKDSIEKIMSDLPIVLQGKEAITNQEEFAIIVKFSYLFDQYPEFLTLKKDLLAKIVFKIKESLFNFNKSEAINLILNQLPVFLIKIILKQINKDAKTQNFTVKNKNLKLRSKILANYKEYANLKSAIESLISENK